MHASAADKHASIYPPPIDDLTFFSRISLPISADSVLRSASAPCCSFTSSFRRVLRAA